jgi:hypothetical protein
MTEAAETEAAKTETAKTEAAGADPKNVAPEGGQKEDEKGVVKVWCIDITSGQVRQLQVNTVEPTFSRPNTSDVEPKIVKDWEN